MNNYDLTCQLDVDTFMFCFEIVANTWNEIEFNICQSSLLFISWRLGMLGKYVRNLSLTQTFHYNQISFAKLCQFLSETLGVFLQFTWETWFIIPIDN